MPEKHPRIAVVVLQWNHEEDTRECLASLEAVDYPNYEIILVDNGSTDPQIQKSFPHLHFLRNETNLGFAEGNNCGIQAALERHADFILLLNNDTTVAPSLLQAFVQAAATHPEGGAFGGKIFFYEEPTTIWYAGGNVDFKQGRFYHEGCGDSQFEKQHETIRETGYACGCALFVRREAIEKVGMLSPDFFLLWEEIDWCWRIRKAGYAILFVPQAQIWHKISRSFTEGNRGPLWQYFYSRNRLLFFKRHTSFFYRFRFFATLFPKELLQICWKSLQPHPPARASRSALKGIRDYFLSRPYPK